MSNNLSQMKDRVAELDMEYAKVPKRKRRFRIAALLYILFLILLYLIITGRIRAVQKAAATDYLKETDEKQLNNLYEDEPLRGNAEALDWFESNMLGISNNNALAGVSWNCEGNTNFKNQIGEVVAYQDDSNKAMVVEVAGQKVFTSEHKASEIIATAENVYYIDEDKVDTLRVYHVKTGKDEGLKAGVSQFAVYGDYLIYLDKHETIYRYSLEDNQSSEIVNHVQRFFLCGSIIAQNNKAIQKVGLDGINHVELLHDALLIGADASHIYYTNFGVTAKQLKQYIDEEASKDYPIVIEPEVDINEEFIVCETDLYTMQTRIIDSSNSIVRAVYRTDEGILIDTIE